MGKRGEAGWRFAGAIGYYLFLILIGWIFILIFYGVFFVDLLWQAITGREGLDDDNFAARWWERMTSFQGYVLFGKGDKNAWRRE